MNKIKRAIVSFLKIGFVLALIAAGLYTFFFHINNSNTIEIDNSAAQEEQIIKNTTEYDKRVERKMKDTAADWEERHRIWAEQEVSREIIAEQELHLETLREKELSF